MDQGPYNFQPLHCEDCGRESGQMYIDRDYDDGSLVLCLDCMVVRIDQYHAEQADRADDEDDEEA